MSRRGEVRLFFLAFFAAGTGATDKLANGPSWLLIVCLVAMVPATYLVAQDYWHEHRDRVRQSIRQRDAFNRAVRSIRGDDDLAALRRSNPVPRHGRSAS